MQLMLPKAFVQELFAIERSENGEKGTNRIILCIELPLLIAHNEKTAKISCVCHTHAVGRGENRMKPRINVSLTEDTVERLKQYAWEHHTTVSQAISDWIWSAKVKNDQIRGQLSMENTKKR